MIRKALFTLAAAAPLVIFAPTQARADHGRDVRRDFEIARPGVVVATTPDCPAGYRDVRVEASPGYYRSEVIPAQYGVRYDIHGRAFTVMVQPEGCRQVWVPPVYQSQCAPVVRDDCPPARIVVPLPRPRAFLFGLFFGPRP